MKAFALVAALSLLAPSALATPDAPSRTQSIHYSVSRPTPSGFSPYSRTPVPALSDEAHARPSFFQSLLLSLGLVSAPPSTPSPLTPPITYVRDPRIWARPQGKAGKWVYIGEGVTRWEADKEEGREEVASTTLIFCDYDGIVRTTTIERGGHPDERRRPFTIKEELITIREGLTRSREIYNSEVDHGRIPAGHRLGGPRCDINNPKPLDQDSASPAYSVPSRPGAPSISHPLLFPPPAPFPSTSSSSYHWVDIGEGVSRWEDSNSPIPPVRMVGGSVRSDVLLRFIDSHGKWRVITAEHGGGPPQQLRPITTEDDLSCVHNEKTREKFFKDNNITMVSEPFRNEDEHPSAEEVHVHGQDDWYRPPPPAATARIEYKDCDPEHPRRLDTLCPPIKNLAYRLHSALQGMTNLEAYFVAFVFGVGLGSLLTILFKIARQLVARHRACAARRVARACSPSSGPSLPSRSVFQYPGQHRKETAASDDTLPTYDAVSMEEKI